MSLGTEQSKLPAKSSTIFPGGDYEVFPLVQSLEMLAQKGMNVSGIKESLILYGIRTTTGYIAPFEIKSVRLTEIMDFEDPTRGNNQATVKLLVAGKKYMTVSEGVGPVDAFHKAIKKALINDYPCIDNIHLVEYQVPPTHSPKEEASDTEVKVTTACFGENFTTVGVTGSVTESSVLALCDAYELCIAKSKSHTKSS
jgi:2-isopropylmalate synthase